WSAGRPAPWGGAAGTPGSHRRRLRSRPRDPATRDAAPGPDAAAPRPARLADPARLCKPARPDLDRRLLRRRRLRRRRAARAVPRRGARRYGAGAGPAHDRRRRTPPPRRAGRAARRGARHSEPRAAPRLARFATPPRAAVPGLRLPHDVDRPVSRSRHEAGEGERVHMSARIVEFALHQRFVTLAMIVLLTGAGIVSFARLPIEAYPAVSHGEG